MLGLATLKNWTIKGSLKNNKIITSLLRNRRPLAYYDQLMDQKKDHFRGSLSSALWLIGAGLMVNAMVLVWSQVKSEPADAGNVVMAAPLIKSSGAHAASAQQNIRVVPTQISASRWGVILVNRRSDVMAVYRFVGSQSRIQLMASRDFRADLKLKDFNNLPPTPAQVKAMVSAGKALTQP